jgi:uncharacterized protein YggE
VSEVSITVRGSAESKHQPERAIVVLDVASEGPTKDAVYAAATQTAGAVTAQIQSLLDPAAGPVTWWAADQVRTWSHRPWNQDGRQLPQVHHAGVQFQVKFSDFEALSRWLAAVVPLSGVSIAGIEWELTDERRTELTNQVRAAAVHDARDKAQAYAASLDLGPVRAVAIADVGMLNEPSPVPPAPVARMAMSVAAPENGEELNLTPREIEISVQVDARFLADGTQG